MLNVYTLKDQVETSVIEAALREAGVKFVLRTFTDSAYDGIFVPQRGYGQVLVENNDRQRAEEIIAAITSAA